MLIYKKTISRKDSSGTRVIEIKDPRNQGVFRTISRNSFEENQDIEGASPFTPNRHTFAEFAPLSPVNVKSESQVIIDPRTGSPVHYRRDGTKFSPKPNTQFAPEKPHSSSPLINAGSLENEGGSNEIKNKLSNSR